MLYIRNNMSAILYGGFVNVSVWVFHIVFNIERVFAGKNALVHFICFNFYLFIFYYIELGYIDLY